MRFALPDRPEQIGVLIVRHVADVLHMDAAVERLNFTVVFLTTRLNASRRNPWPTVPSVLFTMSSQPLDWICACPEKVTPSGTAATGAATVGVFNCALNAYHFVHLPSVLRYCGQFLRLAS